MGREAFSIQAILCSDIPDSSESSSTESPRGSPRVFSSDGRQRVIRRKGDALKDFRFICI